ncbi:MAG: helicase-related protein, partial [Myxococcota bacterium]
MSTLPIDAIAADFDSAAGAVVITAPTGSGKSTQVPRWAGKHGQVVVVEPRRVACRALAARVAELEGTALGEAVGYHVRGEDRTTSDTRIRFITPGIALRQLARLRDATTVILDELHERRLDVDLLLALLRKDRIRGPKRLVVMSATLDAERVATHLDATLLQGEGRVFPVDVRYRDGGISTPSESDLAERVASAVMETEGDTLVFLPGKSEIRAAADALRSIDAQVLELHGGMSLDAQARDFRTAKKRKVVLSTNVAETSLTVPGIEVVIDSGLVRQTRYHRGRAHLALRPIAQDAADQRSGRAGRTRPGIAVRLWARRAALEERSAPEVHRESLVPLVLGAAASGYRVGASSKGSSP